MLLAFEFSLRGTPLIHATRLEVETFLARDLAPESRRAYRSHLRSFYRWCLEEGFVAVDPTERVPPIRVPKALPRPMPDVDLRRALDAATPRMRAWLLAMALGGLRCIEVAALHPEDLQVTEQGTLLFLRECKGGGHGIVPCHPDLSAALLSLPIRDNRWWDTDAAQVSRTVNVHLRRNGVRSTAHSLRHYAITAWYRESEHDLLVTAVLSRHSSVQTVQTYAELDPTRAALVAGRVALP